MKLLTSAPTSVSSSRLHALEALRVNTVVGRARARLSQDDLAARSGVSRPTISRIERGMSPDVGLETIGRIADALGVALIDLLVLEPARHMDDAELALRSSAPDNDFIPANDLLQAIDEANGARLQRYSRAGRPRVAR